MLSWSPRSAIARGYLGVRLDKSAILVRELAGQVGATAVVVNDSYSDLLSVGEPSATMPCRSIRKPLLGALFGRPVIDGAIDLDATLADLGIDDNVPPPLTSSERAARVRDLLTCRSGVYHPSNHQTRSVTLPPRGTHQPGTHFLYNNWDFNALGTILDRHTSKGMFNTFAATTPPQPRHHPRAPHQQRHVQRLRRHHRHTIRHAGLRPLPAALRHRALVGTPHLRLPLLHPRPGPLRPALPARRPARREHHHPAGMGHRQHPRPYENRQRAVLRLPMVDSTQRTAFRRNRRSRRIVRRLRHREPIPAGHTSARPRHRATRRPEALWRY